jgi:hypothetical protein
VLLRQHYGISARSAYLELPEWELELLLSALPDREPAPSDDIPDDPWASPPQDLLDNLN